MEEQKKQLVEKTGIVKAISIKTSGWKSFTLKDFQNEQGKDIWVSTKTNLGFEKGDEVKIKYTIDVGEVYTNYHLSSYETLKKESAQVVQKSLQTPNVPNTPANSVIGPGNSGKPFNKTEFFEANTGNELKEKLNVFGETNNVFATHTHYTNPGWAAIVWYKATVKELLEKEEFPVVKPGQ